MDDVLVACGKHAGRTFQDVFDNEKSYARWVVNVQYPSGPLANFKKYCLTRGLEPNANQSIDTLKGFALTGERLGSTEFRIFAASGGGLPYPIWCELSRLPGAYLHDNRKEWIFAVNSCEAVMTLLRTIPVLSECDLRGVEVFRSAWTQSNQQSSGRAAPSTPPAAARRRSRTPKKTPDPPLRQSSSSATEHAAATLLSDRHGSSEKVEIFKRLCATHGDDLTSRNVIFKGYCKQWHPDKCLKMGDVATDVFQFLQANKDWYLNSRGAPHMPS